MYVPPIAPACAPSMISARPTTPESGRPAAIDFASDDQVGLDAEVLHREHAPRAAEAGLHLVGDEHDPMPVADRAQSVDEGGRRRHEPALAQLRLEHDRRHMLGRYVGLQHPLELRERLLGVGPRYAFGYGAR